MNPLDQFRLDGEVAVVTGGANGLGKAVADAYAAVGARVVVFDVAARADGYKVDVSDEAQVKAAFADVVARHGRVDVLFNNAGLFGAPAPVEDFPLDEWEAVVRTNLSGAFLCAREAFRTMRDQEPRGGRIINNGSISAHAPRPYAVAYTATKHAVTGLTKALSLEGRRHDIACGQIDIGNAATDMAAAMERGVPQPDGSVAPEPVMDIRRVADAVVYMAELPLDANVQFMTVMATKMPFIGRG